MADAATAPLADSSAAPARSGFGRNSFAVSGERCSCFQVMKFFRCLITCPLLVLMQTAVLLWPLTCLYLAWNIYDNVRGMVDSKKMIPLNVFWIAYSAFFLQFLIKIGCRREILPALWVQCMERSLKCAVPGRMLRVERTSDTTSDIMLDADWIQKRGEQRWLNVMSGHIRRSIDMTLLEEMKSDEYGTQNDSIDTPQFFLSGQPGDSIEGMNEIWTCHASVPSFPALYSWCESVPLFRFFVPLVEETHVLGHILLLQTSQPISPENIHTMRNPCASLVPSWVGNDKVVSRRGYWVKFLFGNFPAGKPDAFIFKENMIARTEIKVAHTFRVVASGGSQTNAVQVV